VEVHRRARERFPDEALREAVTMALYVTLVLAAEFAAIGHEAASVALSLGVIWSTTVGLTAIHLFAFGLAAKLVAGGHLSYENKVAAVLQVVASLSIAALVSLPFLLLPIAVASELAGWVTAAVLGVTAYRAAFARPKAAAGRQKESLGGAELWVAPNPSGLNAHAQIADLAAAYREIAVAAGIVVLPPPT